MMAKQWLSILNIILRQHGFIKINTAPASVSSLGDMRICCRILSVAR
jgi:hypothetical protein